MPKAKKIRDAITEVLQQAGVPLHADHIYERIVAADLYAFKAVNPRHIVANELRRHCLNRDFPSARQTKYFRLTEAGAYELLEEPVRVEPTAYKHKLAGRRTETIVTVPREDGPASAVEASTEAVSHTEIQWRLLDLGSRMGLSVWAPMNDRGRECGLGRIEGVQALLPSLPRQFDRVTMKTIGYIDVIWLERRASNPIVAAFEVEHSTPIYSGLLRMADLHTMQPNLDVRWYIVAPAQRFEKFASEVSRPTFAGLRRPLHATCRFLSYEVLLERLAKVDDVVEHLKPSFLDDISELYNPADAFSD